MFCPNCSQQQISEEIKFCSRCGFLLTGLRELLKNHGETSKKTFIQRLTGDSPRKKGLKKGLFIFLLTFLVVPIVSIFTVMLRAEPFAVAIFAILFSVGGILRMLYALLFESNEDAKLSLIDDVNQPAQSEFTQTTEQNALPGASSVSASSYIPPTHGNWRDTNDLIPNSVTEKTTDLLKKEI